MLLTLLILSALLNVVLIYGARNVLRKYEILETNLLNVYVGFQTAYQNMKDMDTLGAFAADDEIGTTFEAIQLIIQDLTTFLGVEEETVTDK